MRLWKLTPVNLEHRNWEASTHQDIVVARAESDHDARSYARRLFAIATRHTPGEEIRTSPWMERDIVSCEETGATADYSADGPGGIVFPLELASVES